MPDGSGRSGRQSFLLPIKLLQSVEQDKSGPVSRMIPSFLFVGSHGQPCQLKRFMLRLTVRPVPVELSHKIASSLVVHAPERHKDAAGTSHLEAALQAEYSVAAQITTSRLASTEYDQVKAVEIKQRYLLAVSMPSSTPSGTACPWWRCSAPAMKRPLRKRGEAASGCRKRW